MQYCKRSVSRFTSSAFYTPRVPFRSCGSANNSAAPVPPKTVSADEAVKIVRSGNRVFMHSVAAFPQILSDALCKRANELKDVEICHIHTEGEAKYTKFPGSFRNNNFFIGGNVRKAVNEGKADWVPIFLSEVPLLFARGILPLDVAFISISPPDRHGYCSLGPSIDVSLAAVTHAKIVVAQVNKHMPRTHGAGLIHVNNINYLVQGDKPLPESLGRGTTPEDDKIGKIIAGLVENGSTLQMGIGAIPDATLKYLNGHKKLGIHTEMFAEGVIDLVEKGVITNSEKAILPGVITASFLMGSKRMWDFVDDNPLVQLFPSEFVNDPSKIRQNPKVVAINSAIEVDVTGQVCADSIGFQMFSGFGGQIDFERGAALSPGGKPIIALPSITKNGESRIVVGLKNGAGVVTTRAHTHWVITEYGAVNLFGKNLRQRLEAMISIAHPSHRERLAKEAAEKMKLVI